MNGPKPVLVVFDVDGTLVDSQEMILGAMQGAFAAEGLTCPDRHAVLDIVGLSLPQAMARLVPQERPETQARLVAAYKAAFGRERATTAAALFPGAAEAIARLGAQGGVILGIATGKSRKGLAHMLDSFGLEGAFATRQTADDHPSKPHPAMLLAALAETGIAAPRCVMVGDTTYDIEMARAAGVASVGVTWGYHSQDALLRAGASRLIDSFAALDEAITDALGVTA